MAERQKEHLVRRRGAGGRAGFELAVFHASANNAEHLAALRGAGKFSLTCVSQRSVPRYTPKVSFDGVLWELTPEARVSWRQLTSISRGAQVMSYSVDSGSELGDLSRVIGFASHLKVPLSPHEVERQLGRGMGGDLATRLRYSQPALRRRVRHVNVLADLVRAVGATLQPESVAETLVARACEWMPATACALVAVEPSGELRQLNELGVSAGMEDAVIKMATWVVSHGEACVTSDVGGDRRLGGGPHVAAVAMPLVCRSRTVGVLVWIDEQKSASKPQLASATREAFNVLLEPSAVALDNALWMHRVEDLSVTDDLTQLYNLRYLMQVLKRETKRAARSGRQLSVLFIDLDGFKSINDAHGHLNGSRALVEAAAVIRGSARETDVVARFGGDEFAMVLPDTDSEGAEEVGRRVRERIAAHAFLAADRIDMYLTASVGVATLPDVAASAEALIAAADKAMYWVKDHGKNGIRVAV